MKTIESVIIISVSLIASRILGSAAAKALLPPINTTFLTLYFSHTLAISLFCAKLTSSPFWSVHEFNAQP